MKRRLETTITVRLPMRSLRLLKADARKRRKTSSAIVRELVERHYESWPKGLSAWDLSKEWVGAVNSRAVPRGARVREALAGWNPDRR